MLFTDFFPQGQFMCFPLHNWIIPTGDIIRRMFYHFDKRNKTIELKFCIVIVPKSNYISIDKFSVL